MGDPKQADREEVEERRLSRREFVQGATATAALVAVAGVAACGEEPDTGTDGGLDGGVDGGADGGLDGGLDGGVDGGTDGGSGAPVWDTIPDQVWMVGVPVLLDLDDYVDDPEGDPLIFALDLPLPPGLTLNGSVISGTPTASYARADFVASADDSNP